MSGGYPPFIVAKFSDVLLDLNSEFPDYVNIR